MATNLPPIPNSPLQESFIWRDWFTKIQTILVSGSSNLWSNINFYGSNIRDITTRQHNALQNIQGGNAAEAYHLTSAQAGFIQDPSSVTITGGSATLTGYFLPQQAPTASAPAYVKGAIYFDTTLNKLRVGGATAWETITSA